MILKKFSFFLIVLVSFLNACTSTHRGKVVISNQSGEDLILKYQTSEYDSAILIKHGQRIDVLHFRGIGQGRIYTNCLNQFKQISLEPASSEKALHKSISEQANWEMVNKNKWRYSNKEILCVFRLDSADISTR